MVVSAATPLPPSRHAPIPSGASGVLQNEPERRWLASRDSLRAFHAERFLVAPVRIVQVQVPLRAAVSRKILSAYDVPALALALSEATTAAASGVAAKVRLRRQTSLEDVDSEPEVSLAVKIGRGMTQREYDIALPSDVPLALHDAHGASALHKVRYQVDLVSALAAAGVEGAGRRPMPPLGFVMVVDHFQTRSDVRLDVPALRGDANERGGRPHLVVRRGQAFVVEAEQENGAGATMSEILGPEGAERFALPWLMVETTHFPGLVRQLAGATVLPSAAVSSSHVR